MGKMVNAGLYSSATDEWATPQQLFDELDREFHFTLDPCASAENHKCAKWYSKSDDGLSKSWAGETVFCNPPYGTKIPKWVAKCAAENERGVVCVMLLPARTDTRWFHDYIYNKAEVRFIKGRVRFGGAKWNAPFPSMIVVFGREKSR